MQNPKLCFGASQAAERGACKLFPSRDLFVLFIVTSNALASVAEEVRGRKKSHGYCYDVDVRITLPFFAYFVNLNQISVLFHWKYNKFGIAFQWIWRGEERDNHTRSPGLFTCTSQRGAGRKQKCFMSSWTGNFHFHNTDTCPENIPAENSFIYKILMSFTLPLVFWR